MGDAIILIKHYLGNRAAKSRGTGRYRAGCHFAATDRGEPARSGFCAAAPGFSAIFPILAQSNAYSPFSRFHPFYLLALVVGNLLPSMGGEKPYYWWNGNCIECPVDRVA
jgi:hypothetical protein